MPTHGNTDVEVAAEANSQPNDRRQSAGNVFTDVSRRSVEKQPRPRWVQALRAAGKAAGASVLLAAGVMWTLKHQNPKYVKPGDLLKLPASLVVAPPPLTEQVVQG